MKGLAPKVIVLAVGTWNLAAGHKPEEIAHRVHNVIAHLQVKCAGAKVLLMGLSGPGAQEANRLLAEEDGERVFFREVSGLAPAYAGCERRAAAHEPELKRWL